MQVVLNTKVDPELRKKLDQYCADSKRSIASVVAEALETFLNQQPKK